MIAFCLFFLMQCQFAFAHESSGNKESEKEYRVIMLSSMEQDEDSRTLLQAIKSQLSDLIVSFSIEYVQRVPEHLPEQMDTAANIAGKRQASAVFWCDLTRDNQVFLYLAEAEKGRILIRQLDGERGGRAEAVAIIIRSLVKSLTSGGEIGIRIQTPAPAERPGNETTQAPPESPVKKTEPEPEEESYWLQLALGYEFGFIASEAIAHGLDILAAVNIYSGLYVFTGYTVWGPVEAETEQARIELWRHPSRIGLGYLWKKGMLSLGGSVGFILDYAVQETPVLVDSTLTSRNNEDITFSMVSIGSIGLELTPRLALRLGVGIEVPFNRLRYLVEINDKKYVILEPWSVQPLGTLGLWIGIL